MRMTLRTKILTYIILLHLVLTAISLLVLLERPKLLLIFEALFLISAVIGYLLVRAFFVPLKLIRTGAGLMREQDFSTHFRTVGQPEMDELVRIYNRMADRLREERLRLEERNLFVEQVVRASPTGVVILDHDGRVADLNPSAEAMLGVTAEQLRGQKPTKLAGPVGLMLGELKPDESRVVTLRGRRVRCRRAEFFDRGAPRSFFLLEELTEELRTSEKLAYGKVIRMMSHEVQNSVAAVGSLIESCGTYGSQLEASDREDFEQALTISKTRLHHLSGFMNGLASVVRVPPPERRPCDVIALLRDLELLLRPDLERRRISLRWETPIPLTEVNLDKNQMEQVLVNVLRNAMEAIGEDGEISVITGRGEGGRWLAIRDSGPGIDEARRSDLLTPFFTTKRGGRGVGLTLSREILAQHGFDHSLDTHPTGGAEFRIKFG